MSFLSTTKTFKGIIHRRGSTSGAPPLIKAPLYGVRRVKTSIFFLIGIRLQTCIQMLHRCVFGPSPFQSTMARFALIMCSSFWLGCPSEDRTLIYATTLIVNCWATVRMCTPWGVIWGSMYSGSSLHDPQHGDLNEFLHTCRTRHFFLQVCCGARFICRINFSFVFICHLILNDICIQA